MKGSDVIGPTVIAVTKTQLGGADLVLPAWARSILAIRPAVAQALPVTLKGLVHKLNLESEDFNIQPYEVLCAPVGPVRGTGAGQAPESPWYPVNCPVDGGSRLKLYGESIGAAAVTTAFMSCQIIVSDKKPGGQYHARVAPNMTATTATGYHAGTPYTITGGHTLEELYGVLMVDGVNLEGSMGFFEWRSNDFDDPTPLKMLTNPIAPSLTDGGINMNGLARAKVEVGMLSPCKITGSCTLADYSAGDFITGVLYR